MKAISLSERGLLPLTTVAGAPRGPGEDTGQEPSFADSLVGILDQKLMERDHGTKGGGNPLTHPVERFDENGFLRHGVPLRASVAMSSSATLPATSGTESSGAPDVAGPVSVPILPAGAAGLPVELERTTVAGSAPRPGDRTTSAIMRPILSRSVGSGVATDCPIPAGSMPLSGSEPVEEIEPSSKFVRAPRAASVASIDVSVTGHDVVTITVANAPELDADPDTMRDAVSRMLARHGLVLGELRVMRKPSSGDFDRRG